MIIVQVPLRVSFFGGGTDFPEFYEKYGGCVLSTAINKYVYVIVKSRFDNKIRVTYRKAELVDSVDDVKHDIVRECLRHVGIDRCIEVVTIGDVPAGTGLGSSSAVTVGVLKALYAYKGVEMDAKKLAEEACYIERNILHKPIGVQDQYITAFGGFRFFEFEKSGVANFSLPTNIYLDKLLLFFTGETRDSGKILEVQRKNTSKNKEILLKMADLAEEAIDTDEFGELLAQEWQLKKQLGPISTPKIDKLYQKGLEAGAIGGKLLGAGRGGFLLFYCPEGTKYNVRLAMSGLTELLFEPEPDGAKVILNYRT